MELVDCNEYARYLGLPFLIGMKKKIVFQDIKANVWKKLQMWKGDHNNENSFFNAIQKGKWSEAEKIYEKNPGILRATSLNFGKSALHIACVAGHAHIVEVLVELMEEKELERRGILDGFTALAEATMNGDTNIAKCMVKRNPRIVSIPTDIGMIPVVLALAYGNKSMARYLYCVTPLEDLLPEKGANGASLLTYAIRMEQYDIAFNLLERCPRLAFASNHRDRCPLFELACTSSAFLSGSQLTFWQLWIYNCIRIPKHEQLSQQRKKHLQHEQANHNNYSFSIDVRDDIQTNQRNMGIRGIYELKLVHHHSFELLGLISEEIKALDPKMIDSLCEALYEAAGRGNVEFFVNVLQMVPELVWHQNEKGSTIFMHAIEFRQPKIFSLIHGFGSKQAMATETDNYGNNMLHMAALLAPPTQLNRIQGTPLQMQRELQWFKEVERIMTADRLESKNENLKTPRELFTENHSKLMKGAEEWMKRTASSSTVVGALVFTVMFAVAFTVPGGNNQNSGYPIFLGHKLFDIFIISDAISLFSSVASVLMFLGILTSRYAEEDFLKSLPTKMMIGLTALFLSLASMTLAFSAALIIIVGGQIWLRNSVIVLACLPVLLFIWLQFSLIFDMFMSTYGPSIFYRKVNRWLIS
ncbi:uncharacterized protein LOC133797784 isoform X1 [Humulus lupulus]|uniref:uncharacterized protein LOC133797784 isoform X1 n=1 Tax=Humulus lupulus TaxID=3486 RepID=UPI002B411C97|nr:uncharacterized protein LOC133797784 isoform X1 [Humulus lupulus]